MSQVTPCWKPFDLVALKQCQDQECLLCLITAVNSCCFLVKLQLSLQTVWEVTRLLCLKRSLRRSRILLLFGRFKKPEMIYEASECFTTSPFPLEILFHATEASVNNERMTSCQKRKCFKALQVFRTLFITDVKVNPAANPHLYLADDSNNEYRLLLSDFTLYYEEAALTNNRIWALNSFKWSKSNNGKESVFWEFYLS